MTLRLSLLAVLCAFAAPLHAATLVIQGSDTLVTHIRSDAQGNNFGSDPSLIVGKTTAPAILRGLLSFDLSVLPADATITGISLVLVSSGTGSIANEAGNVVLNLHQLTGTFVEGGGTAAGTPSTTTATWVRRDGTDLWATPGGDFTTLLSTASADPTTFLAGNSLTFASTADFIASAQTAFDEGDPFGMLLKLNATSEGENLRRPFFFVSDNPSNTGSSIPANSPKLVIDYIPEPGTSALLLGGFGLLAARRRRTRS